MSCGSPFSSRGVSHHRRLLPCLFWCHCDLVLVFGLPRWLPYVVEAFVGFLCCSWYSWIAHILRVPCPHVRVPKPLPACEHLPGWKHHIRTFPLCSKSRCPLLVKVLKSHFLFLNPSPSLMAGAAGWLAPSSDSSYLTIYTTSDLCSSLKWLCGVCFLNSPHLLLTVASCCSDLELQYKSLQ